MKCSACGKENAEGISFCEYCGSRIGTVTTGNLGAPIPATAPTSPDAAAAAAVIAHAGKSLFMSLTLGEKFSAIGAAAAIIGFFLPFVSSPELGGLSGLLGQLGSAAPSHISYSLLDLAKLLGALYFVLLASLGSGVIFYFSRSALYSRKLIMNGFQIMIGSLFGPLLVLILLFVPLIQSVAGLGYWLTSVGFCAIAIGGLIAIAQISKATE